MLLLREKLCEQHRTQDLSKLDKDALNKYRRQGRVTGVLSDKERHRSSTDMEKSTDDLHSDLENVTDTSADALNKYRRQGHVIGVLSDKERHRSSTDVEKSTDDLHGDLENVVDASADPSTALIVKCLKLMLNNRTAKRARLLSAVSITYERSVFSRTSV